MSHTHPPRLEEIKQQHKPTRNVAEERQRQLTRMERLALAVTKRVGTMGFFFLIAGWSALWLGWNILAPKPLRFDPPTGFVLWLFISNLIQILLMPLLMVGQNVLNLNAEIEARNDYEVNLKTEHYVETILLHLEHQNRMLTEILERLNIHTKHKEG
ncbi:MAG: DUF1003 domain-containing protein [Fimbriimonadales bacterium]|nr:DUF1003 domain-containing protein [Fimbriimonadales bacterium]